MSFVTKTLATTATVAALILAGAGAASADVSSTGSNLGTTAGSADGTNTGAGNGNVVQGTSGDVTQGIGNVVGSRDVVDTGNGNVVVSVVGWQGEGWDGWDSGWHGYWHHRCYWG